VHNHFDKNLNLKALILEKRPKVIVECGAGNGDLTRQLASLLDVYHFDLHVISDRAIEGMDSRIKWHEGLSYEVIPEFSESSIGFCIIDTDHNYWTLMKELAALFSRVEEGGMIAMHDVETFYHDTGMALSYWNNKTYPQDEIEKYAVYGSLGDGLIEFLYLQKLFFRLYAWNHESNGAAVIEKKHQPIFSIIVPGPASIFAKKETSVCNASN